MLELQYQRKKFTQAAVDDLMKNQEIVNKVKADEAFEQLHNAIK